MLVKLDHLTYAANRKSIASIIDKFTKAGYRLTLQEEQAKNMPTKMAYMQYQDATHGLHFLSPSEKGGIPVEIVSYENTTIGKDCIEYEPSELSFVIKSKDPDSCKQLFLALGCEEEDNKIKFHGVLDEYPIEIFFQEARDLSLNLDNEGICCPTIFVRPLGKYKKKIEEAGFKCSEIETFEVQGSFFYVFFAEGKGGEILEITSNKL